MQHADVSEANLENTQNKDQNLWFLTKRYMKSALGNMLLLAETRF